MLIAAILGIVLVWLASNGVWVMFALVMLLLGLTKPPYFDLQTAGARAIWQQAMQKWNSLFYCSRCDGVFIPDKDRFEPAEQMMAYLKE